jgi:hypothetical protein
MTLKIKSTVGDCLSCVLIILLIWFLEIFAVEGFEVENGVLGLDRDAYLSLVKFLDSSIVRKVWVSIFISFIFLFLLW